MRRELLERLEIQDIQGIDARARALIVLMNGGVSSDDEASRRVKLLEAWCAEGKMIDDGMVHSVKVVCDKLIQQVGLAVPRYLAPLASSVDYIIILSILTTHILRSIALEPQCVPMIPLPRTHFIAYRD